jgi:hypothetical protein
MEKMKERDTVTMLTTKSDSARARGSGTRHNAFERLHTHATDTGTRGRGRARRAGLRTVHMVEALEVRGWHEEVEHAVDDDRGEARVGNVCTEQTVSRA